ncbi:proton-conducting transporter membrane subunit [Thermodesulfovibrio sp.]|uniref:complex I subunit 5 family protein n=1 Tax=Thermodesulfovibrio sp. TaxID=2067987 RepID=UPI0030B04425
MDNFYYLYASLGFLLLGTILSIFINRKSLVGFVSLIMNFLFSIGLLNFSISCLMNNNALEKNLYSIKPLLNSSLSILVDPLSAVFLIVIAIVSLCVTMFSWKYLEVYKAHSSRRFYPFLMLLFLSSVGVVIVKDLLFFILFWELMTLSSWFLVIFEGEKREALRGGLQYFIATHIATAFLILSAVILYSYSNDFNFTAINKSLSDILQGNFLLSHFILFSLSLAFLTKAGVLPFGFWLPNAYPQPPSSASSFFGGVMSKLAVYALLRFFLSVIPISSYTQSWGFIIATAGVFSIFIGTIAALTQDEAKRLMSFHAIGQVGYMLLGIGAGLYFMSLNQFVGITALTGGLLHLLNNSMYKSLLFLNAGSIYYKTGTTDLDRISGLIRVMPLTTMTALVGSLSIAGVPPFNGFVSKLIIFESSIGAAKVSETLLLIKGAFIVFGIISVFISAITLASFLKFFNSSFMGKMKLTYVERGNVHWSMTLSQIILALICLITGLFPIISLKLTYNAITSAVNLSLPNFSEIFVTSFFGFGINFCKNCSEGGVWFPIFVIFSVFILSLLIFSFERYAQAPKREVETWYGGKEHSPEEVTYTGHSFYQPFKEMVSFRIGKIQFKGLYPVGLPSFKLSMPSWIKKFLNPDDWFYYPFANKVRLVFISIEQIYEKLSKKYIAWLVLGSILVGVLVFHLSGGKP